MDSLDVQSLAVKEPHSQDPTLGIWAHNVESLLGWQKRCWKRRGIRGVSLGAGPPPHMHSSCRFALPVKQTIQRTALQPRQLLFLCRMRLRLFECQAKKALQPHADLLLKVKDCLLAAMHARVIQGCGCWLGKLFEAQPNSKAHRYG